MEEPLIKKCHVHEEPLNVYCFLICHHCTAKVHKDHNCEFSKIAAPDTKKNLLEELASLKQVTANFSSATEDIQTTKQEVKAQGDSVPRPPSMGLKCKYKPFFEVSRNVQEKIDKRSQQHLCQTNANITQLAVDRVQYTVKCEGSENNRSAPDSRGDLEYLTSQR